MIEWFLGKPGNCSCFTPIERAVLFAIGKLLDEPFAATYREQLSLINEVQRFSNGKECNFYIMKFFQVSKWPEDLAFPNIAREYLLGMVTLHREIAKPKLMREFMWFTGTYFLSPSTNRPVS